MSIQARGVCEVFTTNVPLYLRMGAGVMMIVLTNRLKCSFAFNTLEALLATWRFYNAMSGSTACDVEVLQCHEW